VDSGLPDYRGPTGFWKAYPAIAQLGISLEEMSGPEWFTKDPMFAWGFYSHRASLYDAAVPHEGFKILLNWVNTITKGNYFIFTSNIDSQFQKAGFKERKLYECHGSLNYLQCTVDCTPNGVWARDRTPIPVDDKLHVINKEKLPHCIRCDKLARPNVSLFGDTTETFNDYRTQKQKQKLKRWLKQSVDNKLLIIEIGCGISLHSIRIEVEDMIQKRPSTKLIRINPTDYAVNPSTIVLINPYSYMLELV